MLQRFIDDFSLSKLLLTTPIIPVKTWTKSKKEHVEPPEDMTYFCKVVGKLIYVMIWSRPEF